MKWAFLIVLYKKCIRRNGYLKRKIKISVFKMKRNMPKNSHLLASYNKIGYYLPMNTTDTPSEALLQDFR